MAHLRKDFYFLLLKYCEDEGWADIAHMLESRTGVYFDMHHFEDLILDGKWNEAQNYLSGFTQFDDNRYSAKIYFEIRKQSFLEAIDNNLRDKAQEILMNDLKVFTRDNENMFNELQQLVTINNIRDDEGLSKYEDTMTMRTKMMREVEKIIRANPVFHGKLEFPRIPSWRLKDLINQSLNWQHSHCRRPRQNPVMRTLFVNHVCEPSDENLEHGLCEYHLRNPSPRTIYIKYVRQLNDWLSLSLSRGGIFQPAQAAQHPLQNASAAPNPSLREGTLCHGDLSLSLSANPAVELVDHPGSAETIVSPILVEVAPTGDPGQIQISRLGSHSGLPTAVAMTLDEESSPTSMEFHPTKQTILLVGTSDGNLGLWDISSGKKLHSQKFAVWNLGAHSMALKAAVAKDSHVLIVSDGVLMVLYSALEIRNTLCNCFLMMEGVAFIKDGCSLGHVNDLTFCSPYGRLLVITCGDDKTVKVWDGVNGNIQLNFGDHEAPVCSVCHHTREDDNFVFSTSVDGRIKVWTYEIGGDSVDFETPALGCTKLAYTADDQRLFSCGAGKDGGSFLIEWNDNQGTVKRTYQGLGANPLSMVHFDTAKNQILAAGDEHMVKFWEMGNSELLTAIDAGGGLPANPLICINREGTLLAVSTNENRIKILSIDCSLLLLQKSEKDSVDASEVQSGTSRKIGDLSNVEEVPTKKTKITGEASSGGRSGMLLVINKQSQCQSLKLIAPVERNMISSLVYTNAGDAILGLASNGNHFLWRWSQDLNSNREATSKFDPILLEPRRMSNDLTSINPEHTTSCFHLSKNDQYLISSSGRMISLFDMTAYEAVKKFMPSPPSATTCLAFHPRDTSIAAVGIENYIKIYDLQSEEATSQFPGHSERVTSLAFSNTLNVLISAGADAQIVVWSTDGLEKRGSKFLQIPEGKKLNAFAESDTYVKFHPDELHFLAVHKTHLAVYEVKELGCVKRWVPSSSAPITHATFSSDGQMLYAGLEDGNISILGASVFEPYCQINPSAYLPADISDTVYPLVIVANPQKANQFAVALFNGEVYVLEAPEPEGQWGMPPLVTKQSASTIPPESEATVQAFVEP